MGVKKKGSEYQQSYKALYPCFTTVYESNVDYRTKRRLHEHGHKVDPFDWDPSEADSDLGISECQATRRPRTVPKHVYKHEKFNKSYQDRLQQITQQLAENARLSHQGAEDVPPDSARSRDSGVQTDRIVQVDRAVNGSVEVYPRESQTPTPVKAPKTVQAASPSKSSVVSKPKVSDDRQAPKPKHSVQKPSVSKLSPRPTKSTPVPRPSTAPAGDSGEPPKRSASDKPRPPFMSYGCQDQEPYTGAQKTYNVRASAEIHPSALLAQKRRRRLIERRRELSKSASLAQKKKKVLYNEFNEQVRRETTAWDTEYRTHYAGYDRGVYEQNLSARPVTRKHDPQLLITTW